MEVTTVYASEAGEFVVERSRFIGRAFRLADPDGLANLLSQMQKDFPGANHYTWAYRINSGSMRAHDDGEPQGTAGLPILNILNRQDWDKTLVVVVRYFGGIKLGRGGLVRAYQKGAQIALERAVPGVMAPVHEARFELSYAAYERVLRRVTALAMAVEPQFGANVVWRVEAGSEQFHAIESHLNREAQGGWRLIEHHIRDQLLPVDSNESPRE